MGLGWTTSAPRTPDLLFPVFAFLSFCFHVGVFVLIVLALLSFSPLLRDTWTQNAARWVLPFGAENDWSGTAAAAGRG